jgi:single-strand DNA-binding protein
MYHKIELIGRLGKDPEYKLLPTGEVCELSVATDLYKKNEKQVVWFRVSVFGAYASIAAKSLHKGNVVFIEGRLESDETGNPKVFKRRNGEFGANYEVWADKILFLTPKPKDEGKYDDKYDDYF